MIATKSNSGFTLMEVLVGINLSFIVITISVALYLFITNFVLTSIKNADNKVIILTNLNTISSKLRKCNSFEVNISPSETILNTDNGLELSFEEHKITLNNLDSITNINESELVIRLNNKDKEIIRNGKLDYHLIFQNKLKRIRSSEIESIDLSISMENRKYSITYIPSNVSTKHFHNLDMNFAN